MWSPRIGAPILTTYSRTAFHQQRTLASRRRRSRSRAHRRRPPHRQFRASAGWRRLAPATVPRRQTVRPISQGQRSIRRRHSIHLAFQPQAILNSLEEGNVLLVQDVGPLRRALAQRLESAVRKFEYHIIVGEKVGARNMKLALIDNRQSSF